MAYRDNALVVGIVVATLLFLSSVAGLTAPIRDGDPLTIGAILAQEDGTTATLTAEQIFQRGRSGKSFAIKEWFEKQPSQPRLVVVSTRPLPVEEYWTADVTGTLSTFSGTSRDGRAIRQRVLIVSPENVTIYCSPNGKPTMFLPIKGITIEWANKRSLVDLSDTSTTQAASMMAMDAGTFPSMPDTLDSEPAPPAAGSRDSLKWLPNYLNVSLSGMVVSAVFTDSTGSPYFYVERGDRSFGIWIYPSTYTYVEQGWLVDITGYTSGTDAERAIVADSITRVDESNVYPVPLPLGMPNKPLGGGSVGLYTPPVPWDTVDASKNGVGLNTTGLLTRSWGRVTNSYWDPYTYYNIFYINDGSNVDAGTDPYLQTACTGVKVYDTNYGTLPNVGDYVTVTGISRAEFQDETSTASIRTLWKTGDITPATQTGTSATISGTVTAAGTDGTPIHVFCGSASATASLSSGSASYSLSVPAGNHAVTASVLGNKTITQFVTVSNGQTVTRNFALTSIPKIVDVTSDYSMLPHDGTSTVEVRIIVRDMEGRRYPNEPITSVTIDKGQITSSIPTTTDAVGEASFTVQSSTNPEAGLITVTCGSLVGYHQLYYSNPDEPVIWPDELLENQTVSGTIKVKFYTMDQTEPDPSATTWLRAHEMNLQSYTLKIDGQPISTGVPHSDPDNPNYDYPVADGFVETNFYSNGVHTIKAEITDADGNIFTSAPLTLVFDNDVSNITMASGTPGEIDLTTNEQMSVSATFKSTKTWRIAAYDVNLALSGSPFTNETILAQGSGTTATATWNGRLPGYGSDEARLDQVYVEVQTNEGGSWQAAGTGKGRTIGLKTFSDSQTQVLIIAGNPHATGSYVGDYVDAYFRRGWVLYNRAKGMGWKTRRLSPYVSSWQRLRTMLTSGSCRIFHVIAHAGFTYYRPVRNAPKTYYTYFEMQGAVVSKHMNDAHGNPIGAMNIEDLGLEYNNNVLFFFLDGCHSGECGGNSPYSAPIVPDGQYNDMAQMLGCYYFGAGPKVYLGWFSDSDNGPDYNGFIGHQGIPQGMFDMWTAPGTGRILSYVIGDYPNSFTCPHIMYSSNQPPSSWNAVYRNLRIFGTGSFGDNLGMNERDFNIIP